LLSAHVRRLGYAVAAAASGESGVALARSHQPDVVLVDLGLPGIDGWQVVRKLKADARTTGCRIVISSVLDPHHFGDLPRHMVLPKRSPGATSPGPCGSTSRRDDRHPSANSGNSMIPATP
jgi:hypothetical protein